MESSRSVSLLPPKHKMVKWRVYLTVMNLVRAMLLDSGLGKEFWSEAVSYAAFVRNRVPKKGTMDLPQELWTGQKCNVTQLRPFGSTVYVRDHTDPDKLSPRYIKARLMGCRSYSEETVRYYDPGTGKFNYSRDYLFERKSHFAPTHHPILGPSRTDHPHARTYYDARSLRPRD